MKVLFLDIDGVMNTERTPTRWKDDGTLLMMDQEKVFWLNNMVDLHGWKVVLSSDWRHDPKWRENMRANGFLFDFLDRTKFISNTPFTYGSLVHRGHEIKAWLDDHPEVTRFAIVDDNDCILDEQRPNFFKTSWTDGLAKEIADRIEAHLNATV